MGSPEMAGSEGYHGGVFVGAREESGSSARLRLGSSLGASTDHEECFALVNLTGAALQWALQEELYGGG